MMICDGRRLPLNTAASSGPVSSQQVRRANKFPLHPNTKLLRRPSLPTTMACSPHHQVCKLMWQLAGQPAASSDVRV